LGFTWGGAFATSGGGGSVFVGVLVQAARTMAVDPATSIRTFMRSIDPGWHPTSVLGELTLSARADNCA